CEARPAPRRGSIDPHRSCFLRGRDQDRRPKCRLEASPTDPLLVQPPHKARRRPSPAPRRAANASRNSCSLASRRTRRRKDVGPCAPPCGRRSSDRSDAERRILVPSFIQGFELDDYHPLAPLHSNSLVLPAMLAAAPHVGRVSGARFLLGAILGYETGPRVGQALNGLEMLSRGAGTRVLSSARCRPPRPREPFTG